MDNTLRLRSRASRATSRGAATRRRGRRGVVAVEAALVLPLVLTLMLGVWEVGRLIQVSMTLSGAAREGARIAAGGASGGTPATVASVQQAVRDFLSAGGFPSAAVSGAQISIVNQSSHSWTDPADALPLDPFTVTVTIPSGTPFNSLRWVFSSITGINQVSTQVQWFSANDACVTLDPQLPY